MHLSETCEADQPHLIIDVHTTCAAVSDAAMTGPIHHTLAARGLLPSRHLVDSGYIDANLLVTSRSEHGIELMGPARPDTSWLQHAGAGFDIGAFDRLGKAHRALPARSDQHVLDRLPDTAGRGCHPGRLRPSDLPGLPLSGIMHALEDRTAHLGAAGPGAA